MLALEPTRGEARWQMQLGGLPVVWAVFGEVLYAGVGGNAGGDLRALSVATGRRLAQWPSIGQLMGAPVSDGERVYVTTVAPGFRGVLALTAPAVG